MKHTSNAQNDLNSGGSGAVPSAGGVMNAGGQKIDAVLRDVYALSSRSTVNRIISDSIVYGALDYLNVGDLYMFDFDSIPMRAVKNAGTAIAIDFLGAKVRQYSGIYV